MTITDEERLDVDNVMRRIQVQIRYPGELVERVIRTIVRDELEQQTRGADPIPLPPLVKAELWKAEDVMAEPPMLCECGHYISSHVTTPQRHGCFPPEGCDCRNFKPSDEGAD